MKHRTILYILLLATLLTSCGDRITMFRLEQLESQLDSAPDSVLGILSQTPPPRQGKRQALHALLTVLAQEKAGTSVTDDSLINIAIQYYSHRGTPKRRLQAFYSQGRMYANTRNAHEAMMAYTRAMEFAQKTNASNAKALLYTQMGLLCGNEYDYSQGLIYMEEALRCYDDMVKQEHTQNIVKRNIGHYQLQLSRFADAESSIREILEWGQSYDEYIQNAALDLLLRLYDITGEQEALDTLFLSYPPERLWKNTATHAIAAHHYAMRNDLAGAEEALAQAWRVAMTAEDTTILLEKSYQVNKILGRTDDALAFHEQLLAHKDSVVRIKLRHPLAAIQRDYYYSRLQKSNSHLLTLRYLIWSTTLLFTFIGIALWGYHQKRLRHKEQHIKLLQDTLQQNQAELYKLRLTKADDEYQEQASTPPREAILHIYHDNISTSMTLFKQNSRATWLDEIEASDNKEVPFTLNQRRELQEALLSSFAIVISNLYDEAPNLNDKEVLHCLLSSLGYGSHVIKNCLMASSLDAVRMQKFRMKKKLPTDMFQLFFKE